VINRRWWRVVNKGRLFFLEGQNIGLFYQGGGVGSWHDDEIELRKPYGY